MKVLFIFFNYVQKILSKLYALDARFCMHQMQWIWLNNGLAVASQNLHAKTLSGPIKWAVPSETYTLILKHISKPHDYPQMLNWNDVISKTYNKTNFHKWIYSLSIGRFVSVCSTPCFCSSSHLSVHLGILSYRALAKH